VSGGGVGASRPAIPFFDGHNDTLTREDAADFVTGRSGGHLDLARARAGGLAGGIFALFTSTPGYDPRFETTPDGRVEVEPSPPIGADVAAPDAARAAGRTLVRRCAELKIAVDLSHLNEAGFWDVARIDAAPLVASHSGVHALSAQTRNLTDAQLDAIGASGGVVGIVFAAPFLREDGRDDADTPLATLVAHARYAADRIGVQHVGLGSNFDGATVPAELGDVAGLPRLLDALAAAGFTEAEVRAIAWDNWRRTLERAWGG
jgi:microsomal dipeptidase-like Zn-dependent dipeptidase